MLGPNSSGLAGARRPPLCRRLVRSDRVVVVRLPFPGLDVSGFDVGGFEVGGFDRDSGHGIIDAFTAVALTVTFPDLVIEGLQVLPSSVASGGSITVSYNVANRDTNTVTENYTERVYLSTNNTLDGADVLLGTSHLHTADLPLNATHANSESVTIPTPDVIAVPTT